MQPNTMDNDNVIELLCIVHGDPNAKVFQVEINKNKSIAALKKEIWKVKQHDFHDFDADKLDIWQVDIDYTSQNSKQTAFKNDRNVDIQSVLEGVQADEVEVVADVFGDGPPPKRHIHAIVVRPPGK